ncbi:unnamed protein product [Darwinula stevensoni]|uniref:CLIP domain-containing serine protease n=1 Tax=Darwinula stevensoni TaxID=69355 RepID=A0A7R8ZXK0_9CRUS|nr:unnamed protein product [Darwinula stevensoni]CAG0878651.1 unnamed protein product [Darwinula stevensoni]
MASTREHSSLGSHSERDALKCGRFPGSSFLFWSEQPNGRIPAHTIGENCKTPEPNVRPGKCINIKDCTELLSLLRGANRNVAYVRRSVCSITGNGEPCVCCPVEKPPPPTIEEAIDNKELFPDPRKYECGIEINDRIVNGENAPLGAWPWMALLFFQIPGVGVKPICGGAVINKRYVITAAHCFSSEFMGDSKLAFVRLGEHKLSTNPDCNGPNEQRCQPLVIDADVEEIIYHPNFYQNTTIGARFDIALIRLANDIDFKTVRPNYGSDVLQQLKVPIIPLAICSAVPAYKTVKLNEEHICAGGKAETCHGDSGGPLVFLRPLGGHAQYFLIGVVSFGSPLCGEIIAPGVYTRITHYLDWILEHVHE